MEKIPVCFITGFLGSGKTTLVGKLTEKLHGKRILYLVNEFSPRDIDGQRLDLSDDELVVIPGGSIFCKCLAGQFLKVLNRIAGMELEGVVVEASGIANPRAVSDMLAETGLDEKFALASIIAVVDPNSFLKLCRTLPNIKEQVAAATDIIINKTDIFSIEKVEDIVAAVLKINNTARLCRTAFCEADIDIFAEDREFALSGEGAHEKSREFCQVVIRVDGEEKWKLLQRKLTLLGDDLYRVKGSLELGGKGVFRVDFDGAQWFTCEESGRVNAHVNEIVVIASSFRQTMLSAICEQIA